MMKYFLIFATASLALLQFSACIKNDFPYDDTGDLQFTTDTLTFDTVFTAVGSATRYFKVINGSTKPIEVDKITLGGGNASNFRLNVDGVPTKTSVENVRIPAQDSIYVFAEVTVNPNDVNSPFVITDEVRFELNGKEQIVVLEAWGQNANYVGTKGGLGELICGGNGEIVWDSDLPYVVYGVLFVNDCKLRIEAGTHIYVHGALIDADSFYYNDGIIYALETGSIEINGTKDNPVIMEGDRLESDYNEEPGQWAGVLLSALSKGNKFNYVEIKNSIIGVRVDSLAELEITNSIIHNTLSSGLLGYHSGKIWAENCLFYSSSGGNNVQLEFGGKYDFRYCTIASFSGVPRISHSSSVLRMGNFSCLDDELGCPNYLVNPMNANFQNCIIYGSRATELAFSERDENAFNYTLENCIIKVDSTEAVNVPILNKSVNCLVNKDPLFQNVYQQNYELDSLSPAAGSGIFLNSRFGTGAITKDILERDRVNYDLGCYGYQY